jgi:hypothetical protein
MPSLPAEKPLFTDFVDPLKPKYSPLKSSSMFKGAKDLLANFANKSIQSISKFTT